MLPRNEWVCLKFSKATCSKRNAGWDGGRLTLPRGEEKGWEMERRRQQHSVLRSPVGHAPHHAQSLPPSEPRLSECPPPCPSPRPSSTQKPQDCPSFFPALLQAQASPHSAPVAPARLMPQAPCSWSLVSNVPARVPAPDPTWIRSSQSGAQAKNVDGICLGTGRRRQANKTAGEESHNS